MTLVPEWILALSDADLIALACLGGQVELFAGLAFPPHVAFLSRCARREQARRGSDGRVALTNPAFPPARVTLEAGPK